MKKATKITIGIFIGSLLLCFGLGILVLKGVVQENWYIDLVICALGATAFTCLLELPLGGRR